MRKGYMLAQAVIMDWTSKAFNKDVNSGVS